MFLYYKVREKEGGGQGRRRVEWSHETQPNTLTSGVNMTDPHFRLTNSFSTTSLSLSPVRFLTQLLQAVSGSPSRMDTGHGQGNLQSPFG